MEKGKTNSLLCVEAQREPYKTKKVEKFFFSVSFFQGGQESFYDNPSLFLSHKILRPFYVFLLLPPELCVMFCFL